MASGEEKRPHSDEALWKQRFELLAARIEDIKLEVRNGEFEKNTDRAWNSCPVLYVSFCWDIVAEESKAIEMFGAGNYDTYRITDRGPNGGPDEPDWEVGQKVCVYNPRGHKVDGLGGFNGEIIDVGASLPSGTWLTVATGIGDIKVHSKQCRRRVKVKG